MKTATSRRRMGVRLGIRLTLAFVIALATSGCLNANASLTLSGEDRASGDVIVSTQTADGKVPFRLTPPEDLADRVRVTPYSEDGNVGARVSFNDLSFEELESLSSALSPSDSRYKLNIERTGSLVVFEGMVDLTPLASTDSSLFIEISAPGEITSTNGQEGAGTVSWRPEAGEVTDLNATYQYSGARNHEWLNWSLILGGAGLLATVLVGGLALMTHHRARRAAGVRGY